MTTSFTSQAPADPQTPAPVTPSPAPAQPTGFEFEYGGRKFTREELLNKLTHADGHIQTLTNERAEDRRLIAEANAALANAVKLKEVLSTPASPAPAPAPAAPDIASAVTQVVEAREKHAREEANWKAAVDAMTAAFGDKADAKASEMAASLEMTVDDLKVMARTKPAAFRKLFPELGKPATPAPTPMGKGVNPAAINEPPKAGQSGYWDAKSSKAQTAIYMARLKQLSGE